MYLVYTPLTLDVGKRQVEATLPLWLQTEICYSDADRTILDELRKCAIEPTRKLQIESGIEPLKRSVEEIIEQLAVLQSYVQVNSLSSLFRLEIFYLILIIIKKILKTSHVFYVW